MEESQRSNIQTYENSETKALLQSSSNRHKGKVQSEDSGIKARHVLAIWAFLGFVNVYCMRVNLSVALVAMVNSTTAKNSSTANECPDPNAGSNTTSSSKVGEFNWDEATQGTILGAFFYGYIFTQLPGGWLASKFGGKKTVWIWCLVYGSSNTCHSDSCQNK